MLRSILLSTLLSIQLAAHPQKISISIYNDVMLSTILVTPTKGSYTLILGQEQIPLRVNELLYLSRNGDSIIVRNANRAFGAWKRVSIIGNSGNDVIRVKPIIPANPARTYNDNLSFYVDINRILAINLIDIEKYIADVVEAEAGRNRPFEFYKAQALLARTYTISHINRHRDEGFNLCDQVHCQAYKGTSGKVDDILDAVIDTRDLIVVDADNKPITAAFHANCGGQTANSEDVWLTPLPYLVSVPDRYCSASRSARWERYIPIKKWKVFLAQRGADTSNIRKNSEMNFSAPKRTKYYRFRGVKIATTDIRKYFKLRSSWFSVSAGRSQVRIQGRGYGHGVGMCQDGASAMAAKGWTYDRIIRYYFKGVRIVPANSADIPLVVTDSVEVDDSITPPVTQSDNCSDKSDVTKIRKKH